MAGWEMLKRAVRSFTAASPRVSDSKIARRLGSASAWKISSSAALGMGNTSLSSALDHPARVAAAAKARGADRCAAHRLVAPATAGRRGTTPLATAVGSLARCTPKPDPRLRRTRVSDATRRWRPTMAVRSRDAVPANVEAEVAKDARERRLDAEAAARDGGALARRGAGGNGMRTP